METQRPRHSIDMDALADRVIGLKRRSLAKERRLAKEELEAGRPAAQALSDKIHFDAAFTASLEELREGNPLIARMEHDAIGELKSNIGRALALRSPRRSSVGKQRAPLDLFGISVTERMPERDTVEVQDRMMSKYTFVRIGRKIVCSCSTVGLKAPREVKQFVKNYFADTPKPKKVRVPKEKKPRGKHKKLRQNFPKVTFKTRSKQVIEIIVKVDDHVTGLYVPGKHSPVLREWRVDDSKVSPSLVPKAKRDKAKGFARLRFGERLSRQEAML